MENFNFKEILMTHTVTHTAQKNAAHRRGSSASRPVRCSAFWRRFYLTCAMSLPMVWAASSCFFFRPPQSHQNRLKPTPKVS
jgi:hypothetical protein